MILAAEKDKIDFLKECHKHISRIYNTYLTDSERQDAAPGAVHNTPHLTESDEKLSDNLPKSNEVLKQPINWDEHSKSGESIFDYAEATKKRLISSWPTHPNRAGLEAACETIHAAQESHSHKL